MVTSSKVRPLVKLEFRARLYTLRALHPTTRLFSPSPKDPSSPIPQINEISLRLANIESRLSRLEDHPWNRPVEQRGPWTKYQVADWNGAKDAIEAWEKVKERDMRLTGLVREILEKMEPELEKIGKKCGVKLRGLEEVESKKEEGGKKKVISANEISGLEELEWK